MSRALVGGLVGGVACVLAAVILVMAGRNRDQVRRDAAAREAIERRESAREHEAPPDQAALFNWRWIGEVGWPVLDLVNERCRAVQHCRDLPGSERASCFGDALPQCTVAVETLERTATDAPAAVAGLWRFRAVQDRMLVCVYEQNLAAHRERARYMDRVRVGTSSEEHVSGGGAALRPYDEEISRCIEAGDQPVDLSSTDRYLRQHFGCEQVRPDGVRGIRQCCTPQRVAEMVAAGLPALPPDPSCP